MKALIFAAGKGVRMQPLTFERPKPLLEVANRPLLDHIIGSLPDEITELGIVTGYKGEMIRDYFGSVWRGRSIEYLEQKEPLGTGHALMLARDLVRDEEKFLLVYADDLRDGQSLARALKRDHAILVKAMENPGRFGTVVVDGKGRISDIEERAEKPKSNLVVTGAYVLSPKIFDYPPALEKNGEYYINSMLRGLMRDAEVYAEESDFWIPVGYPGDLQTADEALRGASAL